jgi:hypothetical protein
VWTKDILSFSRVGEQQLIDAIPLAEIKKIEGVGPNPLERTEKQSSSQHNVRDSEAIQEGKRRVS